MSRRQRISALPCTLQQMTNDPVPGRRASYEAATSAKFPAHQVNGIWHYFDEDLPLILEAFGLRSKAVAAERPSERHTVQHAA